MTNNTPTVSLQSYLRSGAVQERLEALLNDRASDFTTSLMSVVNANPVLQECKPESVLKAAITAAAMRLPINPGLGFAYIIPYKNWNKELRIGVYEAQFQLGYKGFVQLAMRSNQYKTINVTDVREGEYKGINRLTGKVQFKWNKDDTAREALPVVGYVAYFKTTSGFEKMRYMSVDALKAHATKYSQSYKKGYGMWVDDFESMALKTPLKLLISKYGPMSTDMAKALEADQASAEEDGYRYVDNDRVKKAAKGEDQPAAEDDGVDPPAGDDTDQTPAGPGEAEATQTPPPAPEKSVKERAADFVAKGKAKNAAKTETDTDV